MGTVLATAGTALALFAGTNLDDMMVLAVLSASARAGGRPRRWEIWAGQYAGAAVLVLVSVAAGRGLTLIPEDRIWLLGLLPLGLGIARLATALRDRRRGGQADIAVARGLPGVTAITIANGGDNIAAYTPVFATISGGAAIITVAVFARAWPCGAWLDGGWCPTTASPAHWSVGDTGSSRPSIS
jgi:cadmium resistance protein CadD (predicted permease)